MKKRSRDSSFAWKTCSNPNCKKRTRHLWNFLCFSCYRKVKNISYSNPKLGGFER